MRSQDSVNPFFTRAQLKLIDKTDYVYIHGPNHQHAFKAFAKVPNGTNAQGQKLYKSFHKASDEASLEKLIKLVAEHVAERKRLQGKTLPTGRQEVLTFGKYLDEVWLERNVRLKSLTTYHQYKGVLARPDLKPLRARPIKEVATLDIETWRDDARLAGVGVQTINYVLTRLRTGLEVAVRKYRYLDFNPAAYVEKLPEPKKRRAQGEPTDTLKLEQAIIEPHRAALPLLATTTAVRPGELVGLQWGDIDFERRVLTVRRHVVTSGRAQERSIRIEPGYKRHPDEERRVVLPQRVVEALIAMRSALGEYKLQATKWQRRAGKPGRVKYAESGKPYIIPSNPLAADALVFPDRNGDVWAEGAMAGWFKIVAGRAGVQKTPHGMRHDSGSFGAHIGVQPKLMQEHLGHAQLSTTMDIYTHTLPSAAYDVADAFEGLWDKVYATKEAAV